MRGPTYLPGISEAQSYTKKVWKGGLTGRLMGGVQKEKLGTLFYLLFNLLTIETVYSFLFPSPVAPL